MLDNGNWYVEKDKFDRLSKTIEDAIEKERQEIERKLSEPRRPIFFDSCTYGDVWTRYRDSSDTTPYEPRKRIKMKKHRSKKWKNGRKK